MLSVRERKCVWCLSEVYCPSLMMVITERKKWKCEVGWVRVRAYVHLKNSQVLHTVLLHYINVYARRMNSFSNKRGSREISPTCLARPRMKSYCMKLLSFNAEFHTLNSFNNSFFRVQQSHPYLSYRLDFLTGLNELKKNVSLIWEIYEKESLH